MSGKRPCTSQYKGVRKVVGVRKGTRWLAYIKHVELGQPKQTGKMIYISYFNDEIEAAKAYNIKAKELRGEWAWENPIPEIVEPNKSGLNT